MSENHEIAKMLEGHTEMITRQFTDLRQEVREVKQMQGILHTVIQGDITADKPGIKQKADQAFEGVIRLSTRLEAVEKDVSERKKRLHIGYGIVIGVGMVFPKVWGVIKDHLKVVIALGAGGILVVVAIILQKSL